MSKLELWIIEIPNGGVEKHRLLWGGRRNSLGSLASDSAGQLNVLGHDGHALSVDGTEVGVLKETHEVGLRGLLKGQDGGPLEPEVGLEVLSDLSHETLEGELANEELSRLLVSSDLTKRHGSRAVAVRLLHASGSRSAFSGGLGGELLSGRLASGGLTSGLLGTSHLTCDELTDKGLSLTTSQHLVVE